VSFIFVDAPYRRSMSEAVSVLLFLLWPLVVLILGVNASGAFASERAGKTLDVLLVTPIPGREIVRQKMKPVWRLTLVLVIPFLTLFFVKMLNEFGVTPTWPDWPSVRDYHNEVAWTGVSIIYWLVSTAVVLIYLPMFSYVSLWIGMRTRTRFRAILGTLTTIVAWCILPILLVGIITEFDMHRSPWSFLGIFSPLAIIPSVELDEFLVEREFEWIFVSLTLLWHTGVLFLFRRLCFHNADRYLGRVPYPYAGPIPTEKPHLDM
jgi:ABC-type Na+ efflux pump permease subunit